MAFLKKHGQGLRIDARVRAVTAGEAVALAQRLRVIDLETALIKLGQYQTIPETSPATNATTDVIYLPINFVSMGVWVANAMRLVQPSLAVFRGRDSKKTTPAMMKAGADVLAGVGTTDAANRASSGRDEGIFWLYRQETLQAAQNAARGASDVCLPSVRHNPGRAARRSPVLELSNETITALADGEPLPTAADVNAGVISETVGATHSTGPPHADPEVAAKRSCAVDPSHAATTVLANSEARRAGDGFGDGQVLGAEEEAYPVNPRRSSILREDDVEDSNFSRAAGGFT